MDYITQVFDGHNDTFTKLFASRSDNQGLIFLENDEVHIDLSKARKGGLAGGLFSIFTPPPNNSPESNPEFSYFQLKISNEIVYGAICHEYARQFVDSVLLAIEILEKNFTKCLRVVKNICELNNCFKNNTLAIVLHIEGAEAIQKDLSNLSEYYEKGIRSLGIVWSRPNDFGRGVPFRFAHSPDIGSGLTSRGIALIKECNRLGIAIDLAHINLQGFMDVAGITDDPLIVTHSNIYTLCQTSRNVMDQQIALIGESNGVIGISFVTENVNACGLPDENIPLIDIVQHIDYVAQKIGVDHVALGSDFDGAEMPKCLKDASYLTTLVQALRDKGYDDDSLEKIAFRNWFRVFGDTWKD